jgi:hypothetical protein
MIEWLSTSHQTFAVLLSTHTHAQEPEYLVKWAGRSHIHNEWLPESQLLLVARRKLLNFKKRHGDAPVSFMDSEWTHPARVVARRPSPNAPGWEVLIKWRGQVGMWGVCVHGCGGTLTHAGCSAAWPYTHGGAEHLQTPASRTQGFESCTWESEQCPALTQPEHVQLMLQLWERQRRALARASEDARRAERSALQAAERQLPQVSGFRHMHGLQAWGRGTARQVQARCIRY